MSIQDFKILIFDSGVGGLSIYHALLQEFSTPENSSLASNQYIYFADHKAAPYGDKSDDWLNNRIHHLLTSLDATYAPDVIIIACNTASTLSLNSLREVISTPIVGVVPAIKTAASSATANHHSRIGLLATPATVDRSYTKELIEQFASGLDLISVGTTELVKLAEQKLNGEIVELSTLCKVIDPFIEQDCQHVALGCTHFPLLKTELQNIASHINWIDSGQAIAKRACHIKLSKTYEAKTATSSEPENAALQETNKSTSAHFISSCGIEEGLKAYLRSAGFNSIATEHAFNA